MRILDLHKLILEQSPAIVRQNTMPGEKLDNADQHTAGLDQNPVAKEIADDKLNTLDKKNIPTTTWELLVWTELADKLWLNFETVAKQADFITGTYVDAMLWDVLDPETRKRFAAGINATIVALFHRILLNPSKKNTAKKPEEQVEDWKLSLLSWLTKLWSMDSLKLYGDQLMKAFGPLLSIYGWYDVIKSALKSLHNIMMYIQNAKSKWIGSAQWLLWEWKPVSWSQTIISDPRQFAQFVLDNTGWTGLELDANVIESSEVADHTIFLPTFLASTWAYDVKEWWNFIWSKLSPKEAETIAVWVASIHKAAGTARAFWKTLQTGMLGEVIMTFKDQIKKSPMLNALASFLLWPGRGWDLVSENVVNYAWDHEEPAAEVSSTTTPDESVVDNTRTPPDETVVSPQGQQLVWTEAVVAAWANELIEWFNNENFKKALRANESDNAWGYFAFNKHPRSLAMGAYQFLPSYHLGKIEIYFNEHSGLEVMEGAEYEKALKIYNDHLQKKYPSDKQKKVILSFLANKDFQEWFMDQHILNELMPHAKKLNDKYPDKYSLAQRCMGIHFLWPDWLEKFIAKGWSGMWSWITSINTPFNTYLAKFDKVYA